MSSRPGSCRVVTAYLTSLSLSFRPGRTDCRVTTHLDTVRGAHVGSRHLCGSLLFVTITALASGRPTRCPSDRLVGLSKQISGPHPQGSRLRRPRCGRECAFLTSSLETLGWFQDHSGDHSGPDGASRRQVHPGPPGAAHGRRTPSLRVPLRASRPHVSPRRPPRGRAALSPLTGGARLTTPFLQAPFGSPGTISLVCLPPR